MPAACRTYETVPEQSNPTSFHLPWPPAYTYGLNRILSPAQITSCTWSGASAGAYASPWMILPAVPGTVGRGNGSPGVAPIPAPPDIAVAPDVDVPADDAAPALEDPLPLPPGLAPPAALAAGAPASANAAKLGSIRDATRKILFRGPAGLADGLALKEPAPPADSPRDSPQGTGSPAPRMSSPADSAWRQYTH